jgi:hypothetical protein
LGVDIGIQPVIDAWPGRAVEGALARAMGGREPSVQSEVERIVTV